jgi:hypothetical protein
MSLQNFLGVMKCSCILLCEQKSLKFKFDLNSNWFVIYKTALKKKNIFLFEFGFWAESSVRPSRPPRERGLRGPAVCGRAPRSEAESDPLSRVRPNSAGSDPIGD